MYYRKNFSETTPNENETYTFDITKDVAATVSIISAEWFLTIYEVEEGYAEDPSPSSRLQGAAQTAPETPKLTSQRISGCIAGNTYKVLARVLLDSGDTIEVHSFLPCIDS